MADIAMFDFVNLFKNPGTSGKPDIPSTANLLMFAGYHAYGDAPLATYVRIASLPSNASNPACIQDKLNNWWGLQPTGDHVDVRWFGAKVDDITDDGPALRAALKSLLPTDYSFGRDFRVRTVYVPQGTMRIADEIIQVGQPPVSVTVSLKVRGVTIRGSGPQTTTVLFTTPNTLGFHFDGGAGLPSSFSLAGGGMQSINISLLDTLTGKHGVHMQGNNLTQPNECGFEDVRISTGEKAEWETPFNINGSEKTTEAAGIRFLSIRNIFLGHPSMFALSAASVIGLTINRAGAFGVRKARPDDPPSGPVSRLNFYIYGTTALQSTIVQLSEMNIQDTLWIYDCLSANVSGYIKNVAFASGAKACSFYGTLAGGGYFTSAITAQSPVIVADSEGNAKYVAKI
jgi:Pectate lyase superfamily protein